MRLIKHIQQDWGAQVFTSESRVKQYIDLV